MNDTIMNTEVDISTTTMSDDENKDTVTALTVSSDNNNNNNTKRSTTSSSAITPIISSSSTNINHNTTTTNNNIYTILSKFQKQMKYIDEFETNITIRCIHSRRRILRVFDHIHQQQLYGIDIIHPKQQSMTTSTSTNPTNDTTAANATTTTLGTTPISSSSSFTPFTTDTQNQNQQQLQSFPYTRNSHVRISIHHSYQREVTAAGAMAALMQKPIIQTDISSGGISSTSSATTSAETMRLCKPSPPLWTLHIEGKLLIDHIDYNSSKQRDMIRKRKHTSSTTTANTGNVVESDTNNNIAEALCPQQSIPFTHLFNQVTVTFQTIYELIDPKSKTATTTTPNKQSNTNKKSRRTNNNTNTIASSPGPTITTTTLNNNGNTNMNNESSKMNQNNNTNNNNDTYKSKPQQLIWTLQNDDTKLPPTQQVSTSSTSNIEINPNNGANMWSFIYTEPISPDKTKYKVQSVVAVIELYRRYNYCSKPFDTYKTRYYRIISSTLQKTLFPHHGPITTDILTGITINHNNVQSLSSQTTTTITPIVNQLLNSTHNQVHIPLILTMQEIIMTFYTYIQDHQLILSNNSNNNTMSTATSTNNSGDVVVCDTTLQQLLNMEEFSFSQLRTLLHQRQLIEPVMNITNPNQQQSIYDPVRITYIMEQDGASTSLIPTTTSTNMPVLTNTAKSGNTTTSSINDTSNLSLLQLDMDIFVPHYFIYRLYDLLQQQYKVREQEYINSRIQAKINALLTLPTTTIILPSTTSSTSVNANDTMSAQTRRLIQQATNNAKEEDEKHIRSCFDEWIQLQSSSSNNSNTTNRNSDIDMIPFIPLILSQSSKANTEAQKVYEIDTRIEYLLQQLESIVTNNNYNNNTVGGIPNNKNHLQDFIHQILQNTSKPSIKKHCQG